MNTCRTCYHANGVLGSIEKRMCCYFLVEKNATDSCQRYKNHKEYVAKAQRITGVKLYSKESREKL